MDSLLESLSQVALESDASSRRWRHLLGRLRFRHLQLLVTLSQHSSLRAAAGVMNLTQPSLSKALAELESMLGCALFVRLPRGLQPTAEGLLAMQSAQVLLAELSHLHQDTLTNPTRMTVTIRLGVPLFVVRSHVPVLLHALSQQTSEAHLHLHEGSVPALVASLREGRLDALITSYAAEIGRYGDELCFEKLDEVALEAIAPGDSPLAQRQNLSLGTLCHERWILPKPGSMVRRQIDQAFAAAGQLTPVPWVQSSNPMTNVYLVAQGHGLSMVPASFLDGPSGHLHVARLDLDRPLPRGPVALIYRRAVTHPRVQLLRQALGLPEHRLSGATEGTTRPEDNPRLG